MSSRSIVTRWEAEQHGFIYRIDEDSEGWFWVYYRDKEGSYKKWVDESMWFHNYRLARKNLKFFKYCTVRMKKVEVTTDTHEQGLDSKG